jgi:hypothetical protein
MDQARRDSPVLEQMTLPQRYSGLGLRRTSSLEGQAAYLSAAAQAQQAMSNGPAEFRAFEGPSGDKLWPLWEGLRGDGNGLWRFEAGAPDVANMPLRRHSSTTGAILHGGGMRRFWHPMLPRVSTASLPWHSFAVALAKPRRLG